LERIVAETSTGFEPKFERVDSIRRERERRGKCYPSCYYPFPTPPFVLPFSSMPHRSIIKFTITWLSANPSPAVPLCHGGDKRKNRLLTNVVLKPYTVQNCPGERATGIFRLREPNSILLAALVFHTVLPKEKNQVASKSDWMSH
jgi:hypothetical protein